VKDIASATGIDQRSVSGTLTELRDRRWVQPVDSFFTRKLSDKRLVYYDIAEPLARVVFQMKSTKNGEPIRLLLDFVGLWFDDDVVDRINLEPEVRGLLETTLGMSSQGIVQILSGNHKAKGLSPESLFEIAKATVRGCQGSIDSAMRLPTGLRCSIETALQERGLPEVLGYLFAWISSSSVSSFEDSELGSEIGAFVAPYLEHAFLRSVALCWSGQEELAARLRPDFGAKVTTTLLGSKGMITRSVDLQFFLNAGRNSRLKAWHRACPNYGDRLVAADQRDNDRRSRRRPANSVLVAE
jgi:hypothetical protein